MTAEPCRHELDPVACATCAGIDDQLDDDGSRTFVARFPGVCRGGCGFDIIVGQRIRYQQGMTVHEDC